MRIGLLEIGIAAAVLYLATRPRSSGGGGGVGLLPGIPVPSPSPSPGGGGGGGGGGAALPGFLGGQSGTGVVKIVVPKDNPISWSADCQPTYGSVPQAIAWFRKWGQGAPAKLTAEQYDEYLVRSIMGPCYPPPADVFAAWGPGRAPYLYEFYRAYLQGLRSAKRLPEATLQGRMDRIRNWLIFNGVDPLVLEPYIVSKA